MTDMIIMDITGRPDTGAETEGGGDLHNQMYDLKIGQHDTRLYVTPGPLASDGDAAGPFATLEDAEQHIGHAGGGRLNLGNTTTVVPDLGFPGQIPLLRFFNGIGWRDYLWLEDHPRA